ncbi:MAG: ATP-binding cassette domain-containing protein, partial [Bacteroidota bacterium]
MIHSKDISKTYSSNTVLKIDELKIPRGQSFGLVGNNGAGKTTFFSLLLDLIKPTTGSITSHSIVVDKSEDWKPFTYSFIDESFLIGYLTPEEYFHPCLVLSIKLAIAHTRFAIFLPHFPVSSNCPHPGWQ